MEGVIGSEFGRKDAEYASYVKIAPGSTAQRVALASGTNINVDVQLGAVELKDQLSENRATIAGSRLFTQTVGSHAISEQITVPPVYVGYKGISGVPTEVTSNDAVDAWYDPFGRPISKATNLGTQSEDVSEVSPWGIQTINTVNLNAVGSGTAGASGAWVNVSDFGNKTIYYNFTSGITGSAHVQLEASPDAGTTVFPITAGSLYFVADTKSYVNLEEHHEYIRNVQDFSEGGTLTVTITGRGE